MLVTVSSYVYVNTIKHLFYNICLVQNIYVRIFKYTYFCIHIYVWMYAYIYIYYILGMQDIQKHGETCVYNLL